MQKGMHTNEMTDVVSLYRTRINKIQELGYTDEEVQQRVDCRKEADLILDRHSKVDRKTEIAQGLSDLVELVKQDKQKVILSVFAQQHDLYPSKMND